MIACFGGGGYDKGWWGVLERYRALTTLMRPRLLSFTVESNDFWEDRLRAVFLLVLGKRSSTTSASGARKR